MNKYPNITKACLEVAYDNGGINRDRSEKQARRDIDKFIKRSEYQDYLSAIDFWLSTLPEEDLLTVCGGLEEDIQRLMTDAPPFTDTLLNQYFNEVC